MIAARIASTFLAIGTLLFASLMIIAAIWFEQPPASERQSIEPHARLTQETAVGRLEAELFVKPAMTWQLDIHVARDASSSGPIRPTVVVEMEDMTMGRIEPSLHLLSAGEFHAEGQFPMPGRWRFRVGFERELFDMIVNIPSERDK